MRWLRRLWAEVDSYWFGPSSPTTLGLIRVAIGLVAFLSLAITALGLPDWYFEDGFVPRDTATRFIKPIGRDFVVNGDNFALAFDFPRIDVLSWISSSIAIVAFYGLVMVAALFTAFGLWTRLSSIALAIGIVSLHHRNPLILHGGDSVLRIACLYLAISPCGKACSIDRLRGLWKGTIPSDPEWIPVWPQRLIAFNVALVYFTSAWHKWAGETWRDGTAAWYPLQLNEFKRFPVPEFALDPTAIKLATYGTLIAEVALGTLVFFPPARKYVLAAGLLMHAGIEYSLNIPFFGLTICALYFAFFDGVEIERWARSIGSKTIRFKMRVMLPRGTRLRPGSAATLAAVDPLGLITYEPSDQPSWVAWDAGGRVDRPKWACLIRSVGAWPMLLFPWLWRRLMNKSLEPAA